MDAALVRLTIWTRKTGHSSQLSGTCLMSPGPAATVKLWFGDDSHICKSITHGRPLPTLIHEAISEAELLEGI